MSDLPWNRGDSNPLEDILVAKEKMHNEPYTPFKPRLRESEIAILEQEGHYVDRTAIQIIPEGYDVAFNQTQVESEFHYQEGVSADSVAIVSGGLDSTTLVYYMLSRGYTPHLLSFDYGQRHKKELQFARITARNLGLRHDIIDLTSITHLISNSALTSPLGTVQTSAVANETTDIELNPHHIEVPDGHYAEETMKATIVPNRNMIMLSIATAVAVNNNYKSIATGVHSGDHFIYPDCRPAFINAVGSAIAKGNEGIANFKRDPTGTYADPMYTPFIDKSKADIAMHAIELGVPLHLTWSCYKGGENHCGRCGTCVERLEAIDEAVRRICVADVGEYEYMTRHLKPGDRFDKTVYDDSEFWKVAIRDSKK